MNFKFLLIFGLLTLSCASSQTSSSTKLMNISKQSPIAKFDDSSPVFSGNVAVKMLFKEQDTSHLTGAIVTFNKNARSAWHTHPKGQLLVVTKGAGLVQQWGEKARVIKEGDVVWTPAGVKHWHGADSRHSITHWALQEKNSEGKNVVWMEKVSPKQYKEAVHSVK